MKKVEKILVPTDFSEAAMHAYRYAIWFASHFEAEIKIIHLVAPEVVPMDLPVMSAKLTQQRVDAAREVMKTFVDAGLVQAQTGHDLDHLPEIQSEIIIGMAMDLITDVAKREGMDLVIMGTKGERNTVTNWFGTTTSNTVKRARCPVLVIPDKTKIERIKTTAYATDLTDVDPVHIWEVGRLLSPFKSKLKVIHVREDGDQVKDLSMSDLEQFFKDQPLTTPISFHSLKVNDDPVETIEDFIEDEHIDLLVMFRPRRNFFENIFHKSMTRETVLHADVPLLILK